MIALAARAGWRCVVHCATNGELGERHDGVAAAPQTLRLARAAELEASCRALGAEQPSFWGLPDGGLAREAGQEERIALVFGELRPEVVLALGADGAYGHPDHLVVYRWVRKAWEASAGARPALLLAVFPFGLFLPQYRKCVASGIMGDPPLVTPADLGADRAHYEVEISEVREKKLAAIGSHRTQLSDGSPESMFPPGIVAALLGRERFIDARGARDERTAALLSSLSAGEGQVG
jgi:LmbE family N-acetylglucosaminyl deacetylase